MKAIYAVVFAVTPFAALAHAPNVVTMSKFDNAYLFSERHDHNSASTFTAETEDLRGEIECHIAPDPSIPHRWSWREIEGRKCWYKRVGPVPPKSEFIWSEQTKEVQKRSPTSTQAAGIIMETLVHIEVARVKSVDFISAPNLRLSDRLVDLTIGLSLGSVHGVGGAWQIPNYIALTTDTF